MRFVDTFEMHRMEPNKSFETYLKERQLELGASLVHKHKIYLDTKYWVLLCNQALGKSNDPLVARLSALLHEGVQLKKIICPISADIFLETLKQVDPVTLRCTVELIDKLSGGITILAKQDRLQMELLHFARTKAHGNDSCYSPQLLVWTKLPYVLGLTSPTRTPFTPDEELVIRKAFLDQTWEMMLADMIDTMGIEKACQIPRMRDISDDLNRGKFAHTDENKSLKQMILTEIAGTLDSMKSEIEQLLLYLYEQEYDAVPTAEEVAESQSSQVFANIIYHGFRLNHLTTELPSIRIYATLHAAIRWEVTRKYKPNDMHDIHHAEAALPYFDLFLTEHSLQSLLTRNDLALDKLYGCRVLSKPEEAISEIEKIVLRVDEGNRVQ